MLFKLLTRYLKPYWPMLVGIIVFQFLQAMASLYLPSLNADIIDNGVVVGDTGYILRTGGWMLLVSLGQIACSITAVYFGAKTGMKVGRDMRHDLFTHVGDFSEQEVSHFGAASLITRNGNDVQQVQMLVVMASTMLVSAPIIAIGGVVMAIQQEAKLAWLIAVAVPVLLISVGVLIVFMIPQFRKMQARIDVVNGVLREQLTGIRVIRAFVREPAERKRFADANDALTDTALKAGRLFALAFPIVMLVMNASSVAVVWFGSFLINDGVMQIGSLSAFISYLIQILMSIMMATFMTMMIPRAAVSADRIAEVLDTESSVRLSAHPRTDTTGSGSIELDDVEFSYPGAEKPVLENITFSVQPGQTTAIIGSTGSGKTTLVNLLPRLFDATGGSVKLDGVDVRDLDPNVLWRNIGLVPQKPYLFTGTIADNLRFGRPEATEDELWRALEIAQATDFVKEMPDQLEAEIAQGGTNVSGGQRQRLAIARALVKKPEILIFDDSFSALDVATDARLRAALAENVKDATMVIVAQRVSTIIEADHILVIDNGRIVANGTHEQLLATSETYREIVESQLSAGVSE